MPLDWTIKITTNPIQGRHESNSNKWGTLLSPQPLSYCHKRLKNTMSENFLDIRLNHKIHNDSHEKLESGISNRRKDISCGENSEKHLPMSYPGQ